MMPRGFGTGTVPHGVGARSFTPAAMHYADGGAIDTEDNSGATPVMPSPADNSGAAPVNPSSEAIPTDTSGAGEMAQRMAPQAGQSPPEPAPMSSSQSDQFRQPQGGDKRIISYLMGADAAHPQTLDQVAAQIDPQGQMNAADRNLLAIQHVQQTQGDNAAWQLMQANRVAYNAKTAFAKTALEGTQQKPADLHAALDAANQAQANVLDGSSIHFAQDGQGITATVKLPGTSQRQMMNLTPQQFSKFLDVGGDGQWDKIMEHSAPATLQRLGAKNGAAPAAPTKAAEAPAAPTPTATPESGLGDEVPATNAWGEKVGGKTSSGQNVWTPARTGNYGNELENRAAARFQGVGDNAERQDWMAAQEEKQLERENKVTVEEQKGKNIAEQAKIRGQSNENVATTRAGAYEKSSENKKAAALAAVDARLQAMRETNASKNDIAKVNLLRTKIGSGKPGTPEEEAYIQKLPGYQQGATGRVPTSSPAPQQGNQAGGGQMVTVTSPAEAHALTPGTPYMTPDGRRFTR